MLLQRLSPNTFPLLVVHSAKNLSSSINPLYYLVKFRSLNYLLFLQIKSMSKSMNLGLIKLLIWMEYLLGFSSPLVMYSFLPLFISVTMNFILEIILMHSRLPKSWLYWRRVTLLSPKPMGLYFVLTNFCRLLLTRGSCNFLQIITFFYDFQFGFRECHSTTHVL